ncbi:MAG: hypothetical protein QOD98_3985 [Nocardioidaceae bacterium]|nr:hypothetical protein [Nocardioidaceae bacterium]
MSAEIIAHLLDEMEEYYGAFDYFPLYQLGWHLNDKPRTAEEKDELARRAFDEFASRHLVKVVWVPWPTDLQQARPLEPGTPLDFDLDPDSPTDVPMQVLVPDEVTH